MTEKRIKELMGIWGDSPRVILRAWNVAAEAREEGIEEMRYGLAEEDPYTDKFIEITARVAKQLKEQRK